ncbi:Proteasome subunit alpha type-3 [Bonamia ostreae]|uniref:Proteasome subunit alpha type-3 n=1 Tax=Bonamia ostreae TaxID=126728 RepID=A0ABV2AJ11_9EUKA
MFDLIKKRVHKLHEGSSGRKLSLEMSWVGEETGHRHERVPKSLFDAAMRYGAEAKRRAEMESDSE